MSFARKEDSVGAAYPTLLYQRTSESVKGTELERKSASPSTERQSMKSRVCI